MVQKCIMGSSGGSIDITYEEIDLTANQNKTVDVNNGVYRIGAALQNAGYAEGYIHSGTHVSQAINSTYATVSYSSGQLTVKTTQASTKLFLYKAD